MPITVEKYGTSAKYGQLVSDRVASVSAVVADPDVQRRAKILGEHDTPTGEHVVANLRIKRAVERIGGAGGEPVEHDAGAADNGERKAPSVTWRTPGQGGHLLRKALWQRIGRVAVGRSALTERSEPRPVRRWPRADRIMSLFVPVMTDGGDHGDEHGHHGGPDSPR